MNLICTLYDISEIEKFKQLGVKELVISDRRFATDSETEFSLEQLRDIIALSHKYDMHLSVRCDAFLYEKDLAEMSKYLDDLISLNVDGIYFMDMAIYQIMQEKNRCELLVFDGETTMTNNNDLLAYLDLGLKRCVIAKELTYEKVIGLLSDTKDKSEMIGFGYLRMSRSRRKMLTGYQEAFLNTSLHDNYNIRAREESRQEKLIIFEDDMGTYTYSPYLFWCLNELKDLNEHIDHLRLDRFFVSDELYFKAIAAYQDVLNDKDPLLIAAELKAAFPQESFSTGFLYEQTTL